MFSEERGSLTPNRRKFAILLCVILVVYLGRGSLHPVEVNFHPNTFLRDVLSSEIEENLEKKRGAPLSKHASRR